MRRLWAHIALSASCILACGLAFPTVLKGVSTNGDYRTRRQFTFQLSEREVEDDNETPISLNENSAKDMAEIMATRLETAGVTSYEIETSGNDLIYVTFAADSATQYTQITSYLGFSGSFALMNRDPDSEPIEASEFLDGNDYEMSLKVIDQKYKSE